MFRNLNSEQPTPVPSPARQSLSLCPCPAVALPPVAFDSQSTIHYSDFATGEAAEGPFAGLFAVAIPFSVSDPLALAGPIAVGFLFAVA